MKKIIYYFFILCAVLTVQFFFGSIAFASTNNISYEASVGTMEKNKDFPIPKITKAEQISPNQLQISYDKDVDMNLGKRVTNYWVQDTKNVIPKGIATLGKNDKVNAMNSLTDKLVKIEPKDGSGRVFILTFNQNISRGEEYKLIICYVTVEGAPPYSGDNGMATFVGK